MSAGYSIRIDFDSEKERPERIFQSMALYIEGFNDLQEAFVRGYGNDIEFTSSLGSAREGSCIADICLKIKDSIRNASFDKIYDGIYNGVRNEIATTKKIDSEREVKIFVDKVLTSVASNDADYEQFTSYGDAHLLEVANALHKIHKAKSGLSSKDIVQYGRALDFDTISNDFSCPRNGEQIFEDVSEDFPSKEIFIIRRPSYVNNLQWDFESTTRKNKKISAKMLDEKWLEKWNNHEKQLWSGDALFVSVRTKRKTNKLKKNNISYEYEIVKVIKIIPQNEVKQLVMDFENE